MTERLVSSLSRQRAWSRPAPALVVQLVALGVLVVLTAVAVTHSSRPDAFDASIHHWVVVHRSASSVQITAVVTTLGATLVVVPLLFAGSLFAALGTFAQRLKLAWLTSGLLAAGLVVRWVISGLVGRLRPPVADWASAASGYAFPSGHTTGAAIAAGLLAWVISTARPRRLTRVIVWSIAGAFSIGVGTTRVWLGVHWPTDVLAGWAFALVWTSVSVHMIGLLALGRVPGRVRNVDGFMRGFVGG